MDVTVGDPTCDTYVQHSSKDALFAAAKRHQRKMQLHEKRIELTGAHTDFDFQPLAFETTGAMGKETQKW